MPSVWPGVHVIGEDRRSKNGLTASSLTQLIKPAATDSRPPAPTPRAPYTLMLIPGCVEATIQGLAAAHFGCVRLVLPEVSRRPLLLLPPEPEPELPLHRVHLLRLGASASGVLVSGWLPNLAADGVLSNIQPATANDVLPDLLAANSAMPVMAVSLIAIILAMSAGPIEKRERF
jgi:hypothetical protein